MRKLLLFSALVLLSAACAPETSSQAPSENTSPSQEQSLLDIASPDEVAQELGLPPVETLTEQNMSPMSLAQQNGLNNLDLTKYFPVVILINKSEQGPSSQSLKVYHRGALAYEFDVSTGREQWENAKSGKKYFSVTSTGWFAPTRTYEKYFSKTWQAQMNYSVFFYGGLAIHATTPDHYRDLGSRASGGCVRLKEKNAKLVYDLILSEGKGDVPVFSQTGKIKKNLLGKVSLARGWNTIIIVEDNPAE
jgi:lipoprotein-anchoring transpeptidase ErfK/SrfK